MSPANKYCPTCVYFEGYNYIEVMNYRKKHNRWGCSGIPMSSAEFPYYHHPHCFMDKLPEPVVEDYSI